jgi:hypothetical protein
MEVRSYLNGASATDGTKEDLACSEASTADPDLIRESSIASSVSDTEQQATVAELTEQVTSLELRALSSQGVSKGARVEPAVNVSTVTYEALQAHSANQRPVQVALGEPAGDQKVPMAPGGCSTEDGPATAGQPLPDDIQDALDRTGVATEQIPGRKAQAIKMLKPLGGDKHTFLPSIVRNGALKFMENLVRSMRLDMQRWFEAALLLDVTDCLSPGGLDLNLLPATTVAVVKLIWKTDNAVQSMQGHRLSQYASLMTSWLTQLGYSAIEVTEELLVERESAILKALQWQVNMPSVETWMSMFCMRFNVLTRGVVQPSLDWVSKQSLFFARVLVFHQAAGQGLLPHQQAAGLLALALVSAKLMPLELLKPEKVPRAEWEELFMKSQVQRSVPDCVLPPANWTRMQKCLQVATDMKLEVLQEACYLTALSTVEALQKMSEVGQAIGNPRAEAMGVAAHQAEVAAGQASPVVFGDHQVHHTAL